MRFKSKKQKNEGTKEELSLAHIFFYPFRFQRTDQRAKKKEGRAVSELTVTSLRKPMRFETKKRKNGGAGGGTLPQRGTTGGGLRRRDAAALHSGR